MHICLKHKKLLFCYKFFCVLEHAPNTYKRQQAKQEKENIENIEKQIAKLESNIKKVGKDTVLGKKYLKQSEELNQEYEKKKSLINRKPLDSETKSKELKGAAMVYAAKKREIIQGDSLEPVLGGLTAKELAKKKAYLASNYIGKEVFIGTQKAKIIGNVY